MKSKAALWLSAAFLGLAAAPAAMAQPQTVQQQFDAGSAALLAERWDEAERIFSGLETRLAHSSGRSLAITRVRRATALFELGRRDEAAAALSLGLPVLPATDPSLAEDRFIGLLTLGRLSEFNLDYAAAIGHYREADRIAVAPMLKMKLYRGLIQTGMFFDAGAALAESDEALALAATAAPGVRQAEASLRTLRARVLLNMGRFRDAQAELRRATQLLGGLDLRVDLSDLIARSDLAIASLLAGDREEARRLLSFTGAGRMEEAAVPLTEFTPPLCGAGLDPQDRAVVEFSLRDDGIVGHATPIYSSRQGEAALLFARAVKEWRWNPADLRRMRPIFRAAIRVELRCSLRRTQPRELAPADKALYDSWASVHHFDADAPRTSTPAEYRAQVAAIERQKGSNAPELLQPLYSLGQSDIPANERVQIFTRLLTLSKQSGAPGPVIAMLGGFLAIGAGGNDEVDYVAALANPVIQADPYATARLRLSEAEHQYHHGHSAAAAEWIARVRATPGITAEQGLMESLLELETAVETSRGNPDAATRAWQAIGAQNFRCDTSPRMRAVRTSGADFPRDALMWGFQGWAQAEAVVDGNGRPTAPRATVAWPPFVFGDSAAQIVGRSHFDPAFVPPEGACAVTSRGVRFQL